MKSFALTIILLVLAVAGNAFAFSPPTTARCSFGLSMSTAADQDVETTDKGLMKRDRYIVTNRFAVRRDQQAKFEKRWATRKSRLAVLPGFRYFHLMRRVTLNDDGTNTYNGGDSEESALENYVSFTIWQKKSDFSAWRKGDAFKEAHGGTSIGAFLSTMVNSALVLRGPPRPAFYDGLYLESTKPTSLPETVDGWRSVDADGVNLLPAECSVCLEKFFIPTENAAAFEQLPEWKKQKTALCKSKGFVASSLMRRDAQAKGHGMGQVNQSEPTYVATYIFQDRPSLEKWASSAASMGDGANALSSKVPEKVFYEGTLVISSNQGA